MHFSRAAALFALDCFRRLDCFWRLFIVRSLFHHEIEICRLLDAFEKHFVVVNSARVILYAVLVGLPLPAEDELSQICFEYILSGALEERLHKAQITMQETNKLQGQSASITYDDISAYTDVICLFLFTFLNHTVCNCIYKVVFAYSKSKHTNIASISLRVNIMYIVTPYQSDAQIHWPWKHLKSERIPPKRGICLNGCIYVFALTHPPPTFAVAKCSLLSMCT